MESPRATSSPLYLEQLRSLPVVLVSLFVVVAGVDALIALSPGMMLSLREYWATPSGSGSTSSALAAAATIVGGVALAATALSGFIRGVRAAPYLCITPIWVCACMLAIARVQTPLPLPVPTSAFVAVSALLFVGSGVLFESTSRLSNLIGTAASLLPLTLLSIGYAFNTNAQASFGGDSLLMLFVLALAAAGAPAIAIACRANGAKVLGGPASTAEMAAQIAELSERAREGEERAYRAEQQLLAVSGMPLQATPRLTLDDEHALAKSQASGGLWGWMVASIAGVAIGAGYVLAYAPLKGDLEEARQANAKLAQDYASKLATLRSDFDKKQRELEQQLSATATPAQPETPPPSINTPAPKGPSAAVIAATSDEAESPSDAAEARRAKREQAKAEREAKAAEREANREAARQAREQERAERAAEREKAREERAAESDQKAEERKARAAEKAAARAAEREAKAAERAKAREERAAARAQRATEKAEDATDEKPERAAASAATAALEAQEYGSNASKAKPEKAEKPAPKPAKSEADVENELSDDPLEGL